MSNRHDEFCKNKTNRYPFYSPRFWSGMRLGDYSKLLWRNGFRVNIQRYPMMFLVGGCSVANTGLSLMQRLVWERRIRETELQPPIFVVGHWRSGTTLLHELLSLDDRFCYPTTFQCFVPHHFCVSNWFLKPLANWLLPSKRPMDNMPAGADYPQEDEFALVSLGAPTPYYHFAFCNQPPSDLELLNLDEADKTQQQQMRDALTYFYQAITLGEERRLVLKSPPHTGRIRHLAEWFPGAKFIHITRHPYKIFPSTVHLWRSLFAVQSFQLPGRSNDAITQYVWDCFEKMYDGYFTQLDQIPADDLVEVRFEELIEDPTSQMSRIYDTLDLGQFDNVHQKIDRYWQERKGYQPNETVVGPEIRREIDERWSRYLERYDYAIYAAQT